MGKSFTHNSIRFIIFYLNYYKLIKINIDKVSINFVHVFIEYVYLLIYQEVWYLCKKNIL
jgi:hypothetical protein